MGDGRLIGGGDKDRTRLVGISGIGVAEASDRADMIEGDLESAGEELLIVISGKTSSWTEGDGVNPLSSPEGEERDEGGESSGVPAELRDGDSGISTAMGADPGAVMESAGVRRESPEMVETDAVGDLVIAEDESIEREIEVSSEIVALGTDEMRSDMEAIDTERSTEDTSDIARGGIVTTMGVACSSRSDNETSVLASLMGTYSSRTRSGAGRGGIGGAGPGPGTTMGTSTGAGAGTTTGAGVACGAGTGTCTGYGTY